MNTINEKIGFIGLGQAGGNIASQFEQEFNCLYINSSKKDLSTLNTKYRFHIPDESEGCSHDRDKAVTLAKIHYKKLMSEVNDKLYHQKLIYICFGTGGGTGSGMSSIFLEMLNAQFPDKYFGCVAVLPNDHELPKPQQNSFQCYKEFSNIDKLASVFTLDNNKCEDKFTINKRFYNKFKQIINIPNYADVKGNMDISELFKLLTTRGSIFVSTCDTNNPDNINSTIIRSCEESDVFADIERDKQISYAGFSLKYDINIQEIQKVIGTPYDIFINYNDANNITILSGLTFPKTRISRIVDRVNLNKETIKNNLLNTKTNRITDDLDFMNEFEESVKPKPNFDFKSLDDILKKYGT